MNKYSWGEEKKKVNYNSDHLECSSKRWKKKEKKIYAHLTPYKSASFKFIDYDSYVHFLKGKKKNHVWKCNMFHQQEVHSIILYFNKKLRFFYIHKLQVNIAFIFALLH